MKREVIKPTELLVEIRMSVSEILDIPFTEHIDHRSFQPGKQILARWAADCAERVLSYFEEQYPGDTRPREAIRVLREWIHNGVFSMPVIRGASLAAHAAARDRNAPAAVCAAHAAGQAVAVPHVPTHALGAALYAVRSAAAHSGNVSDGCTERDWQLARLREYVKLNR